MVQPLRTRHDYGEDEEDEKDEEESSSLPRGDEWTGRDKLEDQLVALGSNHPELQDDIEPVIQILKNI